MSLFQIATGPFRENFPPSWYFNEMAKFTAAEKDRNDPFKTSLDLFIANIQKAFEHHRTQPEHTPSPTFSTASSEKMKETPELPDEQFLDTEAKENIDSFKCSDAKEMIKLKEDNVLLNKELRDVKMELQKTRANLDFLHNIHLEISGELKKKTNNTAEVERTIRELKERVGNLERENRQLKDQNVYSSRQREELERSYCQLESSYEKKRYDLEMEKDSFIQQRAHWTEHRHQISALEKADRLYQKERQLREETENKMKSMEETINFLNISGICDYIFKASREYQELHADHILKIEDETSVAWTCFNQACKQLSVRCARLNKEKGRRREMRNKLNRLRNQILCKNHRRLERRKVF